MSSPDDLTKLRTKIDVYEEELGQIGVLFDLLKSNDPKQKQNSDVAAGVVLAGIGKGVDLVTKLLETYRLYVKELEKLKPRN